MFPDVCAALTLPKEQKPKHGGRVKQDWVLYSEGIRVGCCCEEMGSELRSGDKMYIETQPFLFCFYFIMTRERVALSS